jgi:hypothetical protein
MDKLEFMKINISIRAGILFGLIYCLLAYLLALKVGFYDENYYMNKLLMIFAFIFIGVPFVVFIEKIKKNGGYIEFKDAFKTGMLFASVFAIVLSLFNYFYHTFIAIDVIDYFVNIAKNEALLKGKNVKEIERFLNAVRDTFSSFRIFPPTLFSGLIASVLSGAIFQKSNKTI